MIWACIVSFVIAAARRRDSAGPVLAIMARMRSIVALPSSVPVGPCASASGVWHSRAMWLYSKPSSTARPAWSGGCGGCSVARGGRPSVTSRACIHLRHKDAAAALAAPLARTEGARYMTEIKPVLEPAAQEFADANAATV